MRQVPSGGSDREHEAWVARLRALGRADADDLVPRPDFPVYGVAGRADGGLTSAERHNDDWARVELGYGDPLDPAGPYLRARSAVRESARPMVDELVDEHNRIVDHAGVDDPEPGSPPVSETVVMSVDDQPAEGRCYRHGPLWAVRLALPGVAVTIVGRGVELGAVRLAAVADLTPYSLRRGEMLESLARGRRDRPVPELPPAEGAAAHRALVVYILRRHEVEEAARRAGRMPRRAVGDRALWGPLWRRSVAEQRRLTGVSRADADEAVTSMVNHVTHLYDGASWFADPVLRAAAIEEIVRHAVGERVPSEPAQRAWARRWRLGHVADAEWLAAWARWRAEP